MTEVPDEIREERERTCSRCPCLHQGWRPSCLDFSDGCVREARAEYARMLRMEQPVCPKWAR